MSDEKTSRESARDTARALDRQLQDQAFNERRLGLLILDNKDGAALAGAVPHLIKAAEIFGKLLSTPRQAEVLGDLARLHTKAGDHADAARVWADSLRLFAEANDERAIDAAIGAGEAHLAAGDPVAARQALERADALADHHNDHLRRAGVQLALARVLLAGADQHADALATVRKAKATFAAYKRRIQVAACLEVEAQALAAGGDRAGGDAAWDQAVAVHQELGRPVEAGDCLERWSEHLRTRGDGAAAVAVLDRCIALHRAGGKQPLLAQALRRAASLRGRQGDHQAAMTALEEAQAISRQIDDRAGLARTSYLIGAQLVRHGDAAAGLEKLTEAVAGAEEIGESHILEQALSAMAKVQRAVGDPTAALATMRRWVEVLKSLGVRRDLLAALGEMVEVQLDLGAEAEAEAHLQRLVEVCRQDAERPQKARALGQLATLHRHRGDLTGARAFLADALACLPPTAAERPRLHWQLADTILAQIAGGGSSEAVPEALAHFERARELLQDPGADQALRAKVLVGIGNAEVLLGRQSAAKEAFDEAAELCEQQGDIRKTLVIRRAKTRLDQAGA